MNQREQSRRYVLISVCRNEEAYIEGLIDTIAGQKVRPGKWVIVDDGSSDKTYQLAAARAKDLPFIEVARMPGGRARSFSSKVFALQHACELVKKCEFDYIGFLDADIRLEPDYYERLMGFFEQDAQLGLGGGTVIDQYEDRTENIRKGSEEYHVPGGVQFFRRLCFVQVGGYIPVDVGGEDTIADVMAMMHNWKLQVFPELTAMHLRPDGLFTKVNVFRRGMRWGRRFYVLGYHPLFYFGQCLRRLGQRPYFVGSFCNALGFVVAAAKGIERPVSAEFIRFLREMQLARLRAMLPGGKTAKTSARAERRAIT
jgi:glycosyltransferase involved in cell wall biosynthesis